MNSNLQKKEKVLISRCIAGDRWAWEKFVRKFSDLIFRSVQYTFAAKQVQFNHQDLEDLQNTVFLKLFENNGEKLSQFRGDNGCSLATWIKIVTVRTVLNHIRRKGMDSIGWKSKRVTLDDLPELKCENMAALAALEKTEQQRLLQEKIQKLSARDRLFLSLHFGSGCSIKEVAEVMQLSIENAYIIKHRAIKRIKYQIETDGDKSEDRPGPQPRYRSV